MNTPPLQQPPSQTIIERVAQAENADPLDLELPLYEAIDPDALDALFEPTNEGLRSNGQIIFDYHGHTVVVASDGTVTLGGETNEPENQDQISH